MTPPTQMDFVDRSMDFVVFCDTNLGFGLAVTVEHNETVYDLKRKIINEHAAIFHEIGEGEMNIVAIKVMIKEEFYYLPDSMVVRKVFEGDSEKWFLKIVAAPKVDRAATPFF